MSVSLIADSGATKAEWCLVNGKKTKTVFTPGISPYFLSTDGIMDLVKKEVASVFATQPIDTVFFYGTGCSNPKNAASLKKALKSVFPSSSIVVNTDLMAATRAVCGTEKGIACILGTGSNSCYYNGKAIVKNSPGIGFILGDEGSGAYLGKKVVQYYMYNTFDEDLRSRFDAKFVTSPVEILDNVYKQPFPNRYLASFALFLAENRGHYMIENIIEDGLNDFFFQHLNKYNEVWKYPVNFVGSVADGFKDVIKTLCSSYEFELGTIMKNPMQGLVKYHSQN
ncbi:MAG TPA: N-acetylglucosamine kinase [Flavisolibacter sp.]|jgi:N-acetylglucosamine kinase-like BadF-type ATPase|nr:N-acetylglucosamine kinase [Flavisolibacter sp.]